MYIVITSLRAISIHSLRVEGDPAATSEKGVDKIFQSTPSVWRETLRIIQRGGSGFISIHSLRVEGDALK